MIGQRTAVLGSPARPTVRGQEVPLRERLTVGPAVAGRQHVSAWLHRSVLMQLMLSMGLIAFAALIYLNQASHVSVLQFSISDLQQQQTDLLLKNANLYATATSLESLLRIETVATTRLHMTKPDLSSTLWIYPVVPRVPTLPTDNSVVSAQRQSEPLTWMKNAVSFLSAQL